MTSYNVYPIVPSAPPPEDYHLNVVQSKRQGLLKLEEQYKKKAILDRLTWLNACSSRISIATEISSVATFTTFIRFPVSIPLGAVSLAGASISSVATALTKKYQKKLSKVAKLTDIITPALAVFERAVSKSLNDGKIDEEEFNSIQTFHLKTMNELTGIDRAMEVENRFQFEKSLLEEMHNIKKNAETKTQWFARCVISCVTLKMDKIYYQPNHLWKGKKAVKKLKEYSKEKPKVIKQWLSRQAFWQVSAFTSSSTYR